MNGTARERILLALFPAIMISIIWWGWLRPASKARTAAQALAGARGTLPAPADVAQVTANLAKAKGEKATQQQRRSELLARWQQLQPAARTAHAPADTIDQLADLTTRHGLKWVDGQPLPAGGESALHRSYNTLLDKIARPAPLQKSAGSDAGRIDYSLPMAARSDAASGAVKVDKVFWKVEVAGNYDDLVAMLGDMERSLPQVVTVQMKMSPASPAVQARLWTLILAL